MKRGDHMETYKENIIELTSYEQALEAFPVMSQLRTDLSKEAYLTLLNQMKENGYKLFALYKEEEIVALAGISVGVNFYYKKYVFVHDLVTDEAHRSQGYGHKLLRFVEQWAESNSANTVSLESGLQRIDAHRFYEEALNYDKWCYSFRKSL